MKIFVIDEVGKILLTPSHSLGFGTSSFRHYSYAPIGENAISYVPKLSKNMTCCATASEDCIEYLRFFIGGGTYASSFTYLHF